MKKLEAKPNKENLRLSPECRLCARFDEYSIARFPLPSPEKMGFRVIDNILEEHIM